MDEFKQRFSGRYFGKYRGVVVRSDDPKQEGRLMLKVPVVMGQELVGWALPSPPTGGGVGTGDFNCPEKSDFVWVEFEEGDPDRPVWMAGPWGIRGGASMLPDHGKGLPDNLDYAIRDHGNIPPSQFAGTYTNIRTIRGKGGSFLEFDDTDGAERVQLGHRVGTRIEMNSDGGYQEVTTAKNRRRVETDHDVEVGGNERWFVGGTRKSEIQGESENTYGANLTRHFKEVIDDGQAYTGIWEGNYTQTSKGLWTINCGANGSMNFASQLAVMAGKNIQLTAAENIELTALNSLALPGLTSTAMLVHAQNGNLVLKGSEYQVLPATLLGNEIHVVGNAPPATPSIKLGGDLAVQPMVLGTLFQSFMSMVLLLLSTHTHPTLYGPSGPSTEAIAQYATLSASLLGTLSLEVRGK
jgi:hypothetical protein